MKINHALRPDSRWDTYRQSRLRSTQRTLRDDTYEQLQDMLDGPVVIVDDRDEDSWLAWEADEWQNWWDWQKA